MSRGAGAGAQATLTAVTGVTAWVALWSWGGFVQRNGDYLLPLIFGIAGTALVGALARWARMPAVVVFAGQLLVAMLFINLVFGSALLPTPESVRTALVAFQEAGRSAAQYAAPIPATAPSIAPLLVTGGLACYLLVDLCALTLGRVPVAGLPLLTIYSLPVSVLDRSVGWIPFVLAASGFLLMLVVHENDRIARWGRSLTTAEGRETSTLDVRAGHSNTFAMGASAITLAVFVPLLIPTLSLDLLDQRGDGSGGGGDREVRITNPMTDLKRDLVQGPDVPLMQVRTSDPDPDYLRISVLTAFTGNTWTPGGRDLPEGQEADGEMPRPTGMSSSLQRTTVPWTLAATEDLESLWLPAPLYLQSIEAGDEWRYDADTLDIHSASNEVNTQGKSYSLTAIEPDLTPAALSRAGRAQFELGTRYTRLPSNLPDIVKRLATEVTKGRPSDFHRAVALQNWFQREFTYSTDIAPGNGNDELVEFLSEGGRTGYCEQFASAMAVMARTLDIPARVAVGFLEAEPVEGDDDVFEFSTRDMHAWPELYFEGFGWVMFEPTPVDRTNNVPEYTRNIGSGPIPSELPSNTAPTTRPSPTAVPTGPDANAEEDESDQGQGSGLPLLPIAGGGVALLALVGLALLPRTLRRRRTTARWRQTTNPAETAWAELRDTTVDLGLPWPTGRSPRAGGAALAARFAAPLGPDSPERPERGPETNPEASAALAAIVADLEHSRYAEPDGREIDVALAQERAELCAVALRSGVSDRARRRATWWPRSVVSRRNRVPDRVPAADRPRQGVVDSLS